MSDPKTLCGECNHPCEEHEYGMGACQHGSCDHCTYFHEPYPTPASRTERLDSSEWPSYLNPPPPPIPEEERRKRLESIAANLYKRLRFTPLTEERRFAAQAHQHLGNGAEWCPQCAPAQPAERPGAVVLPEYGALRDALERARAEADGLRALLRDAAAVAEGNLRARLAEVQREHAADLSRLDEWRLKAGVAERRAESAEAQLQIAREALLRVNEFADEEFPHLAEIALTALARISKGES